MVDNIALIKEVEIGLRNALDEGHRRGLKWRQMLKLLPEIITDLIMKSECEDIK